MRRPLSNIRKLSSGCYQARYWRLGKQVAADATFVAKADARPWLAQVETEFDRGHDIDPLGGRQRFSTLVDFWLEQRITEAIHPRFSALVWVGETLGRRFGELTA